jgi:Alpha/beta hydrolase domain
LTASKRRAGRIITGWLFCIGVVSTAILPITHARAANPSSASSADRIASSVAVPTVTGPIAGGKPDVPVNAVPPRLLVRYGYSEKEYFLSGTATSYRAVGSQGENGQWSIAPASTAAYRTRIIVRLPENRAKFNGTVLVEWLNETAGRDADPDWGFTYPELMRAGFGYVGVSAQALGVVGSPGFTLPIPGYHPLPLVQQNPSRYVGLVHPGDDYSYDIFSQAGKSLLRRHGVDPMDGLRVRHLVADGESQSAERMVTYVDAVAPVAHVYDGYLIHSRGSSGSPLQASGPVVPKVVFIRTDLGVPVLMTETETDLFGLGFYQAAQPDTHDLATWEMAGTSHADQTTLDYGIQSGHVWSPGVAAPSFAECGTLNDGPESYIMRAAVAQLALWVTTGRRPLASPRFVINAGDIARDAEGNALGGIRTPAVDVPLSALSGEMTKGKSVICSLFGNTRPYSSATLRTLYPTHAAYVTKVKADASSAVAKGFLLAPDAATIVAIADAAPVPGGR